MKIVVKIALFCITLIIISCKNQTGYVLEDNTIVACIGDSITYGSKQGYVEYLQKYADKNKSNKITFLNWGKNSETITGLTENDHPGPRPFLFDRLDSLLKQTPKPDVVTFCYGMNCGIYGLPSEELFQRFRNGLTQFLDIMKGHEIDVVLITPPPLALKTAIKHGREMISTGNYGYKNPYENYNDEVIKEFKKIVLEIEHPAILTRIDINTPLIQNIDKAYGKDPIHPNSFGNMVIAETMSKVLLEEE